jgi:hypothetical protein
MIMQILPENILKLMDPKDRAFLGKGGRTAAEAQQTFQSGEEKKLQSLIANYLNLQEIYFETDRMDRKTSGAKGRPDFRICYRGRWIAVECKAQGGQLSKEQASTLDRIRQCGGVAIVAFGLDAVQQALRSIDSEITPKTFQ